jgi:beta-galactosidase GanA
MSLLIPLIFIHALFSEAQYGSSWPIQNSGYTDVVQWDHYSWIVNGERIYIFGGEMHPFRLPVPEMWEDIMQKMKAGGMNAMSFYSHWGFHEDIQGKLDLKTGARDLSRLLGYARDAGLFVSVRPGPYINGELSAGGLPLWLTTGAFGSLRNNDTRYTAAWMPYHTAIADLVAPYQINQHGTVISYQIENEYPNQWSSQSSKTPKATAVAYFKALEAVVRAQGIDVPTTHNAPGAYASWSKDFDTVGAGGDVDIWGYDTYVSESSTLSFPPSYDI